LVGGNVFEYSMSDTATDEVYLKQTLFYHHCND